MVELATAVCGSGGQDSGLILLLVGIGLLILEAPLEIQDDMAKVGAAIGTGVAWDEKAVDRYTVECDPQ